ncbi:hypothetical protein KM043_010611 [Ampulex compressa]|nr:hypothetical protein KM043_010611 [Ampulex compressa]
MVTLNNQPSRLENSGAHRHLEQGRKFIAKRTALRYSSLRIGVTGLHSKYTVAGNEDFRDTVNQKRSTQLWGVTQYGAMWRSVTQRDPGQDLRFAALPFQCFLLRAPLGFLVTQPKTKGSVRCRNLLYAYGRNRSKVSMQNWCSHSTTRVIVGQISPDIVDIEGGGELSPESLRVMQFGAMRCNGSGGSSMSQTPPMRKQGTFDDARRDSCKMARYIEQTPWWKLNSSKRGAGRVCQQGVITIASRTPPSTASSP